MKTVCALTYQEKQIIHKEKVDKILFFLSEETFSTQGILADLIGAKQSNTSRLLSRLVVLGMLVKKEISFLDITFYIWGITMNGLAEVGGDAIFYQMFDVNRIGVSKFHPRIEMQKVRLNLDFLGWTDWHSGKRAEFQILFKKHKLYHIPLAFVLTGGRPVAIEYEAEIRWTTTYQRIMCNHILAVKHKLCSHIVYISPTIRKKNALKAKFNSIKFVSVHGVNNQIEEHHRALFSFYSVSELEKMKEKILKGRKQK